MQPAGATEGAKSPINDKVIVVGENQEPDTFFGLESTSLATSEVLFPTAENGYNGQNRPAYCNPDYDEQAFAALRELNIDNFQTVYREPLTLLNRDLPTFPLFQRVKIGAYKAGLTGIEIDPTQNQMTHTTEEWDITE